MFYLAIGQGFYPRHKGCPLNKDCLFRFVAITPTVPTALSDQSQQSIRNFWGAIVSGFLDPRSQFHEIAKYNQVRLTTT